MSASADRRVPLRRGHAERAAAWLLTGPLGHLYAVLADVAAIAARRLGARVRARLGR